MANNPHNQSPLSSSMHSAAALGAASAANRAGEVSALQTLVDILSRSNDMGCEPCGGTGVKGRSLCERCRGRGTLLDGAATQQR